MILISVTNNFCSKMLLKLAVAPTGGTKHLQTAQRPSRQDRFAKTAMDSQNVVASVAATKGNRRQQGTAGNMQQGAGISGAESGVDHKMQSKVIDVGQASFSMQ